MRRHSVSRRLLPAYRAGVFAAIVWCLHNAAQRERAPQDPPDISSSLLSEIFPLADRLEPRKRGEDWNRVIDAGGHSLGSVLLTSPQSDHIVGYSGSTNTLLALDDQGKVAGMRILKSGDTDEHVGKVIRDEVFMTALNGRSWETLGDLEGIDGVSGATLTSRAILQGIAQRVSGSAASLKFPRPLDLQDAKQLFESAERVEAVRTRPEVVAVYGANARLLGHLTRTSPYSDAIMGYQGPTDVLIALDEKRKIISGLKVRDSFETPDYVDDVAEDTYFMTLFNGKTLDEMTKISVDDGEIEGVSGATMTSVPMAEGLAATARALVEPQAERKTASWPAWRLHDLGTLVVIIFGVILAFTSLRGRRSVRVAFQVLLVVYLGFTAGHLLSLELIGGWAQHGIPWRTAPGLVLLALAAFLVPLTTSRQIYCHQLCPHGAAQQLLKSRLTWKLRVPKQIDRLLRLVPFLLLGVALAAILQRSDLSLAGLEAFDAYLIRIAGWSSIVIAIAGLLAACFVPMAYCKYGCPTGAILNFFWASGNPQRFSSRDWLALMLLVTGMAWLFLG